MYTDKEIIMPRKTRVSKLKNVPEPLSLEAKGLAVHLSELDRNGDLNGYSDKQVLTMLNTYLDYKRDGIAGLSKHSIARLLDRHRETITHWLKVLKKERGE